MDKDIAIKVENVSKTFCIPHEKVSTLKGAFVSVLNTKENSLFCGIISKIATLDKSSVFAIINPAKTTRYDPLGMAGFF
jgi:hypothetical protein